MDIRGAIREFQATCNTCHTTKTFEVDEQAYCRWREGALIQHSFPDMMPDDRELLISGICGKCFDKMFEED